jgi:hypothetical protein
MTGVRKPPQTIKRRIQLEEPISSLLDDYCKFVNCTNFVLKKRLARDPDYKKWQASQSAAPARKETALSSHSARTA